VTAGVLDGRARAASTVISRYAQTSFVAAIAWGAFAFGAVYPWAYWPLVVALLGVAIAGLFMSAPFLRSTHLGGFAIALGFLAITVAIQLLPLPLSAVRTISPHALDVLEKLDLSIAAGLVHRHPLSVAPGRTGIGLALFVALALFVLGSARLISIRGARGLAEGLAIIGVILALIGVIQKPMFTGRIYGFWTPREPGAPFGPVVNQNHFAGWMLMALPVTIGLLGGAVARGMHGVKATWRDRVLWLSSPDASRLMLLAAAAGVMALSLVLTMSRSGIAAMAGAVAITGIVALRRQRTTTRRAFATSYLVLLIVVTIGWVGVDAVVARFTNADWSELNDRRGAWADAIGVISDFPLVGAGLDTYGVTTMLYQRHDLSQHYAEAHNDYLQLAAEGGVLLTIPAVLCLAIFVRAVHRRFREETSPTTYWIRVGAVTGLTAIALQEAVDFSLQMPGNAALFAALCGIALHTTPERRTR
jgi:hypothetical protein